MVSMYGRGEPLGAALDQQSHRQYTVPPSFEEREALGVNPTSAGRCAHGTRLQRMHLGLLLLLQLEGDVVLQGPDPRRRKKRHPTVSIESETGLFNPGNDMGVWSHWRWMPITERTAAAQGWRRNHKGGVLTSVITLPAFFLAFRGLAFPPCTRAHAHSTRKVSGGPDSIVEGAPGMQRCTV